MSDKGVAAGSAAHRRAWEAGQVDYQGRDSFYHIQQQLERNIVQPPSSVSYHPSQIRPMAPVPAPVQTPAPVRLAAPAKVPVSVILPVPAMTSVLVAPSKSPVVPLMQSARVEPRPLIEEEKIVKRSFVEEKVPSLATDRPIHLSQPFSRDILPSKPISPTVEKMQYVE